MPWKTMKPIDQRLNLIADWQTKHFSITDLSEKYGVSRPTIYKWLIRYEQIGIDGLKEQSRKPMHSPNQTDETVVDLLIAEKLKNVKRGPKKIYYQLKEQYPNIELPSISTIGECLKRNGLVKPRKKRLRVPPYTEPFKECLNPNSVWSTDFKGQFYTKSGQICYPHTVGDNYSRFLLTCNAFPGPRYLETRKSFERTFEEYGLPDAIRMDNGVPFAGRAVGGLSRLMVWWIQLGITPERIDKGCPQQNGRLERLHRTLKAEALDPVALNLKEQQKQFDLFRYDYNHHRPHEALEQQPPIKFYKKSNRPYFEKVQPPYYDLNLTIRKTNSNGRLKFGNKRYYLSETIAREYVALKEIDDGLWSIYYYRYKLATLDLRKKKIIK